MNIATRIAQHFGLTPLHDVDLPHEPSTAVRPVLRAVDSSPTGASAGTGRVGGPAAPVSPGAAGIHPSQIPVDWRQQLAWAHQILAAVLADHDAGVIDLNGRR